MIGACLTAIGILLVSKTWEDPCFAQQGGSAIAQPAELAIHVSKGKFTNYYHLLLTLRPQNFELTVPSYERRPRYGTENRYAFAEGGQFEVFVRKDAFPVLAPMCDRYIILRMPATSPSTADAAEKLKRKKVLFEAIKTLKESGAGELSVAVEVNPYVRVVTREPLRLELIECNAFFRQAHGAYVDSDGPLPQ